MTFRSQASSNEKYLKIDARDYNNEYENYSPFSSGAIRDFDINKRHEIMDDVNIDMLVAHHPHVLQGVELYNNKLIVHSLGNFMFDSNFPETFSSVIFYSTIDFDNNSPIFTDYKFKPIYIDHYIQRLLLYLNCHPYLQILYMRYP